MNENKKVSDCCGAEIHKHHLVKCDEWGYDCVCGNKTAKYPICEECWNKCEIKPCTPVEAKREESGLSKQIKQCAAPGCNKDHLPSNFVCEDHAPRPAEGSWQEEFDKKFSDLFGRGGEDHVKQFIAEERKRAKQEGYDAGRAWHDYGFKEALSSHDAELRKKIEDRIRDYLKNNDETTASYTRGALFELRNVKELLSDSNEEKNSLV